MLSCTGSRLAIRMNGLVSGVSSRPNTPSLPAEATTGIITRATFGFAATDGLGSLGVGIRWQYLANVRACTEGVVPAEYRHESTRSVPSGSRASAFVAVVLVL